MNHAPGTGLIARPVNLQSSPLPLCHGCLLWSSRIYCIYKHFLYRCSSIFNDFSIIKPAFGECENFHCWIIWEMKHAPYAGLIIWPVDLLSSAIPLVHTISSNCLVQHFIAEVYPKTPCIHSFLIPLICPLLLVFHFVQTAYAWWLQLIAMLVLF